MSFQEGEQFRQNYRRFHKTSRNYEHEIFAEQLSVERSNHEMQARPVYYSRDRLLQQHIHIYQATHLLSLPPQ